MVDTINVTSENMIANKGEGIMPSPATSPTTSPAPTISSENSTSNAADSVDISPEVQKISNSSETQKPKEVSKSSQKENESETEKKLKESVAALNEKLNRMDLDVLFKVDKRINKNYISVVEKNTKKVIREFPPEEIRSFIARFDEINERLSSSRDAKSMLVNLVV